MYSISFKLSLLYLSSQLTYIYMYFLLSLWPSSSLPWLMDLPYSLLDTFIDGLSLFPLGCLDLWTFLIPSWMPLLMDLPYSLLDAFIDGQLKKKTNNEAYTCCYRFNHFNDNCWCKKIFPIRSTDQLADKSNYNLFKINAHQPCTLYSYIFIYIYL